MKAMPITSQATPAPVCGHATTIGSYPGEGWASCHRPKGHTGDHEGTYEWEQKWPECDGCPVPE